VRKKSGKSDQIFNKIAFFSRILFFSHFILGQSLVEVSELDLKTFLYFLEGPKNYKKKAKNGKLCVKKVVKVKKRFHMRRYEKIQKNKNTYNKNISYLLVSFLFYLL
jgi:hypothetical protein